jgi:hypothetical protein
MTTRPLTPDVEDAVRQALLATWSERTQPAFCPETPSYNQCAQTAIVVFERFGGEILKTKVTISDGGQIEHFYNRIGGQRYDFTWDQFEITDFVKPINYQDIPSSPLEAKKTLQSGQLDAMRSGFNYAYKP